MHHFCNDRHLGISGTLPVSLIIKLVRHGESRANINEVDPTLVGDHTIELTERGRLQAVEAGRALGPGFFEHALVFTSPFLRARETLAGLIRGAGLDRDAVRAFEDPRLREVERGYASDAAQKDLRRTHGWFYYRFEGGESPADCYDRTSNFLEGMMRQVERNRSERVLIVTHGLTIRCFVMRFLHLTVDEFTSMASPNNCDVITLADKELISDPMFTMGRWGVCGLRRRESDDL